MSVSQTIENTKVSIKENESVTAHTYCNSTQPYYVSALSILRYIAKTLTETAEPSSEIRKSCNDLIEDLNVIQNKCDPPSDAIVTNTMH